MSLLPTPTGTAPGGTLTAQWYAVAFWSSSATGRAAELDPPTLQTVEVQAGSESAAEGDVEAQYPNGASFTAKGPYASQAAAKSGGAPVPVSPNTPAGTTPGSAPLPAAYTPPACSWFVAPEGVGGYITNALAKNGEDLISLSPKTTIQAIKADVGLQGTIMSCSQPDSAQSMKVYQADYGQCYSTQSACEAAAQTANATPSSGSPQFGLSLSGLNSKGQPVNLLTRFLKILVGGVLLIAGVLKLTNTEQKLRTALPKVATAAAGVGLIA